MSVYVCMCVCVYIYAAAKSLQSCPTLCDPIDGSPPGSPIPGILQARTLEWVYISQGKFLQPLYDIPPLEDVYTKSLSKY